MNAEEKPAVFPQYEEFPGRQFELPVFSSIGCGEPGFQVSPAGVALPGRLQPVYELLERAMVEVYKGYIPASRGTAMAVIARACVSVLAAGELEERVRELESRIGGNKHEFIRKDS